MKFIDLLEAFEIELNKLDNGLDKPRSLITEYFLNAALDKFWKTRYSGVNSKTEGFEQTQKRIDDLRTLVEETELDIETKDPTEYTAQLPTDYLLLLGDRASILPVDGIENECWNKDKEGLYIPHTSDTIEGSIETVDKIKENSLSEFHLRFTKAKPIRLISKDKVTLYTDGLYKISKYTIQYLRQPKRIDIHSNPFANYEDMPEHTHLEIVKLAAQLYIENQADTRYNSYTLEVIPSME